MHGDELLKQSFDDGSYFSNPFPLFAELRKTDPVFFSHTLGGWIVTRFQDVSSILHNHEDYSSKGRVLHLINKLDPEVQKQLPLLQKHFATGLAHSDAPEHKRLRGLLAQAFTPKVSESMRPITRDIVQKIVSELASTSDLIQDIFTPVPALVVGRLLGSSEEDVPDLVRWAGAINGLYEKGGLIDPQKAIYAEEMLNEIRDFVFRLANERRATRDKGSLESSQDILAGLVNAETLGDSLTESELVSTVVTLFVAGHETTTHLLGNGLLALLNADSQMEKIKSQPDRIPNAIDEMARFDGSVPRSWRITKRQMEVSGVLIPEGQLVLPMLSSANRDESEFASPDSFDIDRDTRKHLAFGRGVHVCLGAPLARIEGQEIITELLTNFPNMKLKERVEDLSWRRDVALRGLTSLPVQL
jgi:cytochrome P450